MGMPGLRRGVVHLNRDLPTPKKVKPPRSHWDMLRERRSIADLEQVLAERLALIRGDRDGDVKERSRKSA